jgi:hypothetical protein
VSSVLKEAVDVRPPSSGEALLGYIEERATEIEDVDGVELRDREVLVHLCGAGADSRRAQ